MRRRRIGLIINPVAGMGGRVGLKGTDGEEAYKQALSLGASPEVDQKVIRAFEALVKNKDKMELVICNGIMGESALRSTGLKPDKVLYVCGGESSRACNTEEAALQMLEDSVDLIVFAGGDGTARLLAENISKRRLSKPDMNIPCLGIPAGVKIQSSVFAKTPREAGDIISEFIEGRHLEYIEGEVVDLDETLYRQGIVAPKFHGTLLVPSVSHKMQSKKARTQNDENTDQRIIATEVVKRMENDMTYLIGPGSTTQKVMQKLGLESTLIGIDAVKNGQLIGQDLTETQILNLLDEGPAKIVLTPIGGQGFLLGRGNQQISPAVIEKVGLEKLIVIATSHKINGLSNRQLLVDTGCASLDKKIRGYIRVITGIKEEMVVRVQ